MADASLRSSSNDPHPAIPVPEDWSAAWRIPVLLVLAACALLLASVLWINGGRFGYTLDDAYIHLAVAENLVRGHYGVNLGEMSSPSSSILWPVLLAPLARTALADWVPLSIDLACAAAATAVFARAAWLAFEAAPSPRRERAAAFFALLCVLATNQLGLVFTGMEHSLQVALAAAIALGMTGEARSGVVPRWLLACLVLGPLVRYEMAALSFPAVAFLWMRGHRTQAAGVGGLLVATLGGFSLWLKANGLPALPASVMAHSHSFGSGFAPSWVIKGIAANLEPVTGRLLALSGLALAFPAFDARRPRAERALAAWAATVVALHVAVGRSGWYGRYEAYAWTVALLVGLHLYRTPAVQGIRSIRPVALALGAAAVTGLAFAENVRIAATTPLAANNIYVQQRQMHRFVVGWLRAPVAVNDLGWVSYRNDRYVLDLYGLASWEAQQERRRRAGNAWMERLAQAHGARVALLYDLWMAPVPPSWVRVGVLRFSGPQITPASRDVAIYARGPASARQTEALLRDFRRTLPKGASVVLALEAAPSADR